MHGQVYGSILETVGQRRSSRHRAYSGRKGFTRRFFSTRVFNPLGSVKDRIGLAMVEDAEAQGLISPGRTVLVEPTSGNTGISLAFVAAARGYRLIVTMPESASTERRKMMRLLNAHLELTPSSRGMAGAIDRARELVASLPDAWMPSQFDNPSNPDIHAHGRQRKSGRTRRPGGYGRCRPRTGGTLTGIARTLARAGPEWRFGASNPLRAPSCMVIARSARHSGIGPGFARIYSTRPF
ncbi:PLP-dependent cysteine synthase family protein [Sorlinia euscelidii]|uniref:Tryptophan synthase beta chain-like PALP domain-containing protein n=1 Tax=Sorlinia euscelidii TaxID=3081148 RepID=A0ABU7U738_9PROT